MNGPEQLPYVAQPAGLSARTVRWLRVLLLAAVAAVFGLLYLLSSGFRSEVNQALGLLGRGDIAGLRNYILSFGLWAPVASCFLMVLQALVAPVPSFLITFANGLAFGVFWGWILSLFGRLIPGVAFDVISYAAGLTRMRFRNFIFATTLGIFPQTFLYSYLGQRAPEYVGLFLVTSGLVVAGVVAVAVVRYRRERRRPKRNLR